MINSNVQPADLDSSLPPQTRLKLVSSEIPDFESKVTNLLNELRKENLTLSKPLAEVLTCRGFSEPAKVKDFLSPTLKNNLPNPFTMLGAIKAAEILADAVISKNSKPKKITIFTDFDVDGISSGAQLLLFLHEIGASVSSYTPNRFTEGYGLSAEAVKKIAANGAEILVTVDCGISNKKELLLAKKLGLETVVIDHHQVLEMPEAGAIINPCQEGCPFHSYQLSAAGLVWMFLLVLRKGILEHKDFISFKEEVLKGDELPNPKDFLDLAALGTICDMVPLSGPNRLIALRGLEALTKSERPGLKSLIEVSGVKIKDNFSSGQVSFMLGPRINAAGRVGEGKDVIELLSTKNPHNAKSIAQKIELQNKKRQKLEKEGLKTSLFKAEQHINDYGISVFDESFHLGVIGIIAQRLVQKFHKPAIVMAPASKEEKDLIKGSVRSVKAFDVAASLGKLSEYLISFGGHRAAGGFSLKRENLADFEKAFLELTQATLSAEDLVPLVTADTELLFKTIDFNLVEALKKLEPFGTGNPAPVFLSKNISVDSVRTLASEHLKLQLSSSGRKLTAVAWKFAGNPLLQKDRVLDIAYAIEVNQWKGISNLQLNIKEVWPV